jgi:pyridoxine 4-dehydrogenase
MAQVALNWCICKGTIPIPGAKNPSQALENLGALGWRLNDGEVTELETIALNLDQKMIQNVFQTK